MQLLTSMFEDSDLRLEYTKGRDRPFNHVLDPDHLLVGVIGFLGDHCYLMLAAQNARNDRTKQYHGNLPRLGRPFLIHNVPLVCHDPKPPISYP
jgi:hypothetical protein